jgi:hypothetical protein
MLSQMTPMWFFILSFAVYRVVRLWLADTITEPLRSRVIGGEGRAGWLLTNPGAFKLWLMDLLTCQWCLGIWVSFAAVAALALSGLEPYDWSPLGVTLAVVTALALAAVQSFWHLVEDVVLAVLTLLEDGED